VSFACLLRRGGGPASTEEQIEAAGGVGERGLVFGERVGRRFASRSISASISRAVTLNESRRCESSEFAAARSSFNASSGLPSANATQASASCSWISLSAAPV